MRGHPTTLELELARTGEAGAGIADHLAGCAACRAEVALLERLARDQAVSLRLEAPARFEEEMRALALRHANRVRASSSPKRRLVRLAPWAAAAVVVVATAGALWRGGLGAPRSAAPAADRIARGDDVNGDGRLDVLDAFALARAVESGTARPAWDVNRDGAVDGRDVDAVAAAAVALGGDGR
jgi:predicted anti-sigma-YlaC factor YlaD